MLSSSATMARTMRSSTSVNAREGRPCVFLPFPIRDSIQSSTGRQRIHVVHILAFLWRVGRTRVAAFAPGLLGRHGGVRKERIACEPPEKVELAAACALRVFDAIDQHAQCLRIPGIAGFVFDPAVIECTPV